MKKIVLCADDYALNDTVSAGIIKLAEQQKISATSCMTNSDNWLKHAKALEPHQDKIDIGLHFNLPQPSLAKILLTTNLHTINKKMIHEQFNRQLDLFISGLNKLPDFIDGHQHIHQLPVISDTILEAYQQRLTNKPYIRHTKLSPPFLATIKQLTIALANDFHFKKKLTNLHIPHNSSFGGIYNFTQQLNYRDLFKKFLAHIKDGGIIMCHPGLKDNTVADPISNNRTCELNYLLSDQFERDCAATNVKICRRL